MILLSNSPHEAACRQKLIDALGAEDEEVLVQWLYERHCGRTSPTFGEVLDAISKQTEQYGVKFAQNILDVAKKPKHIREAEVELIAWIGPKVEHAASIVQGHRGDFAIAKEEFDKLCYELEEKLCAMFPGKHRATMKGAIVSSFLHKGGAFSLDVSALVRALEMKDPLEATAAMSRA
jgi:hypothetical protein